MKTKQLLVLSELESALSNMKEAVAGAKRFIEAGKEPSQAHAIQLLNGLINLTAIVEIHNSQKDCRCGFLYDILDGSTEVHNEAIRAVKQRLKSRLDKCR